MNGGSIGVLPGLSIRPASAGDSAIVFGWRNRPEIVVLGSLNRTVSWPEHDAWFAQTVNSEDRRLFLIQHESAPIGQVRFDREGSDCEVSIYLLDGHAGRGWGPEILVAACTAIGREWPVDRVLAYVREDNAPSLSGFRKAGFLPVAQGGAEAREGHRVLARPVFRGTIVPHNRLTHGPAEVEAVTRVVASGHWAGGPELAAMEADLARMVDIPHAVGVGSGTAALRLALQALALTEGEKVAVPAYSCVALANAVLSLGAIPVPVESRSADWNIDPESAARTGARVAIAVHSFGAPADIAGLQRAGLIVVEDASHGFPPNAEGWPTRPSGDAVIASFYATKYFGGGEGGAVLVRDAGLADSIRDRRSYVDKPADPLRLNDKMSDLAAALVRVQLRRMPDLVARRQALARIYGERLAPLVGQSLVKALPAVSDKSASYRYCIEVEPRGLRPIIAALEGLGVRADRPVEPWADVTPPTARRAFESLLSLPLYPTLTDNEQDRVCQALERAAQLL
jgi:perosamine synthetase